MRAAVVSFALMLAAAPTPAGAHTYPGATPVEWEALPCAVACSYWVDNGYTPCAHPFPPGSFDDVLTAPAPGAPGSVTVLEAVIDPAVDWDLFICVGDPPTDQACPAGGECSSILGEPCDNPLGANHVAPVACHEDVSIPIAMGERVTLRAYNWSDPLPVSGRYWFTFI